MKRHITFTGALLLASVMTGEAMAACPGTTQVTGAALTTLLEGKTVCVGNSGNWESQEYHSGGNLIDWKMGAGHATDPTEQVGTYTINTPNSTVNYDYGSGGNYTYTIYGNDPYSFCNGSTEIVPAKIFDGQGAC